VRRGRYRRCTLIDFILESCRRLYVVKAKCWPAYSEGKFKKLTLSNLNKIRRGSEHHSSKTISLRSIGLKGGVVDGKILVW